MTYYGEDPNVVRTVTEHWHRLGPRVGAKWRRVREKDVAEMFVVAPRSGSEVEWVWGMSLFAPIQRAAVVAVRNIVCYDGDLSVPYKVIADWVHHTIKPTTSVDALEWMARDFVDVYRQHARHQASRDARAIAGDPQQSVPLPVQVHWERIGYVSLAGVLLAVCFFCWIMTSSLVGQ